MSNVSKIRSSAEQPLPPQLHLSNVDVNVKPSAVAVILLLYVSSLWVPAVVGQGAISAPATLGQACSAAEQNAWNSSLDNVATANAVASGQYSQRLRPGERAVYNSIFEIDHLGIVGHACSAVVETVNVVFTLTNSTGFVGNLVVSEDPGSLIPIGSLVQNVTARSLNCYGTTHGSPCPSFNWAGYEVYANNQATATVLWTSTNFTQLMPSYPSTGCATVAGSASCTESTWTGLVNSQGAGNGNLVQTGTEANCIGGAGCTPSYYAWYELLPANQVQCTGSNSVTISGGDKIYVDVMNEALPGGSNSKYDINVIDWNNLTSCQVNGLSYTSMTAPTEAIYIAENTEYCTVNGQGQLTACASLPKFGTITFSYVYMYGNGAYHYVNYFTSSGYDFEDEMKNAPGTYPNCGTNVNNVIPGSVTSSSGSSFTDPWSSSANTPGYITGC